MVAHTSGRESGLIAVPLDDIQAKHVLINGERTMEVGHLHVNVSDANPWVKRTLGFAVVFVGHLVAHFLVRGRKRGRATGIVARRIIHGGEG